MSILVREKSIADFLYRIFSSNILLYANKFKIEQQMIQQNSPKSPFLRKHRNYKNNKKLIESDSFHSRNMSREGLRSSLKSNYHSYQTEFKSAIVCNYETNRKVFKQIYEKSSTEKRQIASLTKIMTMIVALEEIQKNDIVPEEQIYVVSKEAALLAGTSAYLEAGDRISLWDLLHGLMLPSGNDAAQCIAENIGSKYLKDTKLLSAAHEKISTSNFRISSSFKKWQVSQKKPVKNDCASIFIEKMNLKAKQLGMHDTIYTNPHGLNDEKAYSTAWDQMLLIDFCLKNEIFRKIVKTKLYFGSVEESQSGWTREMLWQNTNRLLYHGYSGIKTGNTTNAKYCLASWYQAPQNNIDMIIVVLGCENRESRDKQTVNLTKMGIKLITNQKNRERSQKLS